jgi:hypothetical protein
MAISTYEAIGSVTITTGVNRISFNNIPATYTDLELVFSGTSSPDYDVAMQFNGDSTPNYSANRIYGDGTGGGASDRGNNESYLAITIGGAGTPGPSRVSINNYATNQQYKTVITRSVYPTNYVGMSAKLYRRLAPINSITIIGSGSSNLQNGTVISLYGIGANQLKATGGDIIQTDGTYWYHAFKTSGTFTPNSALSCDAMVIAGGGGGGGEIPGGGGAGGFRAVTSLSLSGATTVTVGAGGAGSLGSAGTDIGASGSNSIFSTITSAGGGGGGGSANNGAAGGSGGGGWIGGTANGGAGNTPSTSPVQGYAGGGGANQTYGIGGGGGGAGGVGATGGTSNGTSGKGGIGVNTYAAWASVTGTGVNGYYAGGGGGGTWNAGSDYTPPLGGAGGGGNGWGSTANAGIGGSGVPNTGGGGGGGGNSSSSIGGNGGSGLVIVRYAV